MKRFTDRVVRDNCAFCIVGGFSKMNFACWTIKGRVLRIFAANDEKVLGIIGKTSGLFTLDFTLA